MQVFIYHLGSDFSIYVVLCFSVSDADVRIVPSRLQLFDMESVSFTCEGFVGSAGWKVRNIKRVIPKCPNVTCNIEYVLPSDTGEYWCEGGEGQRSNTVNITVTGMFIQGEEFESKTGKASNNQLNLYKSVNNCNVVQLVL